MKGSTFCRALAAPALLLAALTVSHESRSMDFRQDFEVDLTKYTGLWFEIARTPNRFQDNRPRRRGERFSACTGTTAEYTLAGGGRIAVTNRCIRRSPSGKEVGDVAGGMARVVEGSKNRRLHVAFGPWIARFAQRLFAPREGNYWIHCLGPEVEGRYSWSVVSDNRRQLVWMLAREPSVPEAVKSEMAACAREAGLPVEKLRYRRRQG